MNSLINFCTSSSFLQPFSTFLPYPCNIRMHGLGVLQELTVLICSGLNSLQSGLHKQHMKDLFVELCLTVPVRLSSLLPYLPMLMDPLVSALNGSPTLISQVSLIVRGGTVLLHICRLRKLPYLMNLWHVCPLSVGHPLVD